MPVSRANVRGTKGVHLTPLDFPVKWGGFIPAEAFARREDIISVIFPDHVTAIGRSCFDECINLERVTFPPKLRTIGASAFYCCKSIVQLDLPSSVREIHDGAFRSCIKLGSFTFPPSLKKALKLFGKNGVFHNCNLLPQTLKDGWEVHLNAEDFKQFGSSIPKEAFLDRKDIRSIRSFPDRVTEICEGAFNGCWNMEAIVLPPHLKVIGRSAFNNCSRLTTVVVPGAVEEIRDFAFVACSNLATLIVLQSATAAGGGSGGGGGGGGSGESFCKVALGSNIFNMCPYLQKVSAPDSVVAAIQVGPIKECAAFDDLPLDIQKQSPLLQLEHYWWRFQKQNTVRLSACQRDFIFSILLVSGSLKAKEYAAYYSSCSGRDGDGEVSTVSEDGLQAASTTVANTFADGGGRGAGSGGGGGVGGGNNARAEFLPAMPTEIWMHILTFVLKCELGRYVVFD